MLPPAEALLASYFDPSGTFAGETFDGFGVNDPNRVNADDLLAVTMLDVSIRPRALRRMLGAEADSLTSAFTALPGDLDLWDADRGVLDAVDAVDEMLRTFDGVGPVIASKLLSRKRPRLVPVIDSVVLTELGQPSDAYKATRRAFAGWLRDDAMRARLAELAAPLPSGVSPIRVLDVVLWMRGSGSEAAREVRRKNGLPGHGRADALLPGG